MKKSQIIIHVISVLLAICGAILAFGDRIDNLPLPPNVVAAWPFVFFIATLVDRIGMAVIATLQKPPVLIILLLLIPSFFLSGCGTIDSISAGGNLDTSKDGTVRGGGGNITIHLRNPRGFAK